MAPLPCVGMKPIIASKAVRTNKTFKSSHVKQFKDTLYLQSTSLLLITSFKLHLIVSINSNQQSCEVKPFNVMHFPICILTTYAIAMDGLNHVKTGDMYVTVPTPLDTPDLTTHQPDCS